MPFFKNGQYHATIEASGQTESKNARYEAEIFIVPIQGKEYLFSIGKGDNKYAELYDLDSCEIKSQKLGVTLMGSTKIASVVNVATSYKIDNNYYVIFPFIDDYLFTLKKLNFSSTNIEKNNPVTNSYSNMYYQSNLKSVSCFTTELKSIICFGSLAIMPNFNYFYFYYYYFIGAYKQDLTPKVEEILYDYQIFDANNNFLYFSKSIHLEREAGVFIFYKGSNNIMETYPTIIFKYLESNSIKDYFSTIPIIELKQISCKNSSLLNDIIKITNKKLCFISTSNSKEILYIALINIINKNSIDSIVLRYYSINIFLKYTFKIMGDMKLHLYNNYVAFAFSFCHQSSCEVKSDTHHASFLIFSYPNGIDYNLNLTEYLFNDNNIKIYNLEIDLKDNIRIDNNIFGLVFSGIKIKRIYNCPSISFFSSLYTNSYINQTSILKEDEKIKVSFNSYNSVECLINYIYLITEPDFEKYNSYCQRYGEDTEDIFKKEIYESRVLDYYIKIDEQLETKCTDNNCELCLFSKKDFCFTCKYNYTIHTEGNNKRKECYSISDAIETTEIEIKTTQVEIETTQTIKTTQLIIDTTQIIESTQLEINTMKSIETNEAKIDKTQNIEKTESQIDTIQLIEENKDQINKTQETTETKIDKTQLIEIIEIINTIDKATNNKDKIEEDFELCSKDQIINNECRDKKIIGE